MKHQGLIAEERLCAACSPAQLCDECGNKENSNVDNDSGKAIVNNDETGQSEDEMNNDEIGQSEDEMNNDEILQHNGPGEIVWGKYRKAVIAYRIKNSKNGSLWS